MKEKLEVGDNVVVNFNGSQYTLCTNGEVISIPRATGDSWVIKDLEKDVLHYISEGCTISKLLPVSDGE